MIDDGEWAGVPIGGLGAGSIGLTHRGDFARWHLRVGQHRFLPVAADGFALALRAGDETWAGPLVAGTAPTIPAFGPALPEGAGTYHALFPRAWFAYDHPRIPIGLVCEQLAPFLPGDEEASSLPLGLFTWTISNPLPTPVTVGLLFTMRDPRGEECGETPTAGTRHHIVRSAGATGILLPGAPGAPADLQGSFALAVGHGEGVDIGARPRFDPADAADAAALWADFSTDARLDEVDDPRPSTAGRSEGAALSATVELAPGESRTVTFALAWDLPIIEFGGGRRWRKRYTDGWGTGGDHAFEIAAHGLEQRGAWRTEIEAWQAPVLDDPARPEWYQGALFNELYYLLDGGTFWGSEAETSGATSDMASEQFGLLECFDYAYYNTSDVNFSASFALLALWPRLELLTIRNLAAMVPADDPVTVTIRASGRPAIRKLPFTVAHDVGGPDEDPFHRPNRYDFQDVNAWKDLAPKLALQVWRDYRATGDLALLEETWPSIQRVLEGLATHDRDGDGLPEHDESPDQTYDTWPILGPSAYGGSLWLGALRAAEEIARVLGDAVAAEDWAARFRRARDSFERRLWRGDHYAFDDGGGASADSVMADQLAGQWYADATDLGDLVAPERIIATLRTIHERNVLGFAGGTMGAVNGTRPDGTVDHASEQSEEVWVGTVYALAAFMLGRGLVDEAWGTAAGAARVTYERGLWFRTPEAYDEHGDFRASLYLRPLAIWAIEDALRRLRAGG
jgi:non-lysosomal glucosylceramidase